MFNRKSSGEASLGATDDAGLCQFVQKLTHDVLAAQEAAACYHEQAILLIKAWIEAQDVPGYELGKNNLMLSQVTPINLTEIPGTLSEPSRSTPTTPRNRPSARSSSPSAASPSMLKLSEMTSGQSKVKTKHQARSTKSTSNLDQDSSQELLVPSKAVDILPATKETSANDSSFSDADEIKTNANDVAMQRVASDSTCSDESKADAMVRKLSFSSCHASIAGLSALAIKPRRLGKTSLISTPALEPSRTGIIDQTPTSHEIMKAKVRQALNKPVYNVFDLYKKTGIWQRIAKAAWFENFILCVIGFNALWIAYDADQNDAPVVLSAHMEFQIVEHLFCIVFSMEWLIRYLSFKHKSDALHDAWFVFDSLLVGLMIFETWLLSSFMFLSNSSSRNDNLNNASVLRIGRLLRLSRMARMARLLRTIPELVILVKGMFASARSVMTTLFLLFIITYVFGIAFKQLCDGTEVGGERFPGVLDAMYTLILYGVLCLDFVEDIAAGLIEVSIMGVVLYFLYILLACFTVMNMLIGVLCEVVSAVAAAEKEATTLNSAKDTLQKILWKLDTNRDMLISREEFTELLNHEDACVALTDMGVDVLGLVELADDIFESCDNQDVELTFTEFMNIVIQLKGSSSATVKDIVDLRKLLQGHMKEANSLLKALVDMRDGTETWSGGSANVKKYATR